MNGERRNIRARRGVVLASGAPADRLRHALEEALALSPDQLPALYRAALQEIGNALHRLLRETRVLPVAQISRGCPTHRRPTQKSEF